MKNRSSWLTITLCLILNLGFAQEEIVFGFSGDASGPAGEIGSMVKLAVEDYCQYANEENLIPGFTLSCLTRDDAFDNAVTAENFADFVEEGMVAYLGYSTDGTLLLKPEFMEAQMPVVSTSYHIGLIDAPNNDYNFLPITSYSEQVVGILEWIAKQHPGEHPKVVLFAHSLAAGRAPLPDAIRAAERLGVEIVEIEESAGFDAATSVKRWHESGAQYVIVSTVNSVLTTMLTAAQEQGILDALTFTGWHFTGGPALSEMAGASAEGFLWATSYHLAHEDVPGMHFQRELGERFGRDEATIRDMSYTSGLLQAAIMVEAAKRAAAQGEVTKESIHQALLNMHDGADGNFDPGFGVGPVSFGENDRIGVDAMRLIQFRDGVWQPLTEPMNAETFAKVHPSN